MARKLYPIDGAGVSQQQFTNTTVYSGDNLTGVYKVAIVPQAVTSIPGNAWKHIQLDVDAIEAGLMLGMVIYLNSTNCWAAIMAINGTYILTYEYNSGPTAVSTGVTYYVYNEPWTTSTKVVRYSGSWTVPTGITRARVTCIGGGGGGGACSVNTGAQGGQAGGLVTKTFTNLVPGTTYNFIVGGPGPGGDNYRRFLPTSWTLGGYGATLTSLYPTNNSSSTASYTTHPFSSIAGGIGAPGGSTYFNGPTKLYAIGGIGGIGVYSTGSYSAGGYAYNSTSIGGGAFGGDINIAGSLGDNGAANGSSTITLGFGGKGGSTLWGSGGQSIAMFGGNQVSGVTGTGYGSGGSAAASSGFASAQGVYGGAGRFGAIIIEY